MHYLLSAMVVLAAAPSGPFPEDLAHFNALVQDETKLVEAVRQFDILQKALYEWDVEIAESLAAAQQREEARAKAESAQKRIDLVGKAYRITVEQYPKNARALNYYGEHLYDYEGDQAGAIAKWKLSAAEDPKLALPLNNLAIHYTHVGEYKMGLDYYNRAIELDPDNPDYRFNIAQTYLTNWPQVQKIYNWDAKKLFKEAMKHSKRAAELKPNDYRLLEDYAKNFFASLNLDVEADWEECAAAWRKARERAQRNDQVFFTWLNEARAYMRKRDRARALACLDEALKIIPDNDVALTLRARVQAGDLPDQ